MQTLRQVYDSLQLPIVRINIGRYDTPPCSTIVNLVIHKHLDRLHLDLVAEHQEPGGPWTETVNADSALDRVGEQALHDALAELSFESHTPTGIVRREQLAELAPEMLDS